MELNNVRVEAGKVAGLEYRLKSLQDTINMMGSEKQDLTVLVSGLRDQLNEMEDEKSEALNDEGLMKEKLKYVVKEKDILNQKIKALEGMYKSELGEVQHAEEVMKKLRKTELDLEHMRKNEHLLKRERAELLQILQGTKDQLAQIESQRDHFEDAHDRLAEELQRALDTHKTLFSHNEVLERMPEKEPPSGSILQEIKALRTQLGLLAEQKEVLLQENKDLQARLEEHVDRIYAMETSGRLSHSIDAIKLAPFRRSTEVEDSLNWTDLENILRYKLNLDIPEVTASKAIVDCVDQLADSLSEGKANITTLQNQIIELRADKISLLEKLELNHSTQDSAGTLDLGIQQKLEGSLL